MDRPQQQSSRDRVATPPIRRRFSGATLDEIQATIDRFQPGMRIAPLQGKEVACGFDIVDCGPLRLIEGTWPTGAQLTTLGERFILGASVAGIARHDHRGQHLELVPGRSAGLTRPGEPLSSQHPPGFLGRSVSIVPPTLEDHAALLRGTQPGKPSELPFRIDLTSGAGVTVEQLIALLWKVTAQANPSPVLLANLRDALLTALVTAPSATSGSSRARTPPRAPGAVARRVEAYIDAHAREPLALADLVAVAGVSGRTLQIGFRAAYGVSPMAYVQRRRLARAREDLLSAAPGTTVAEVARRLGFVAPGRFSLAYRRCFGESPSQTLARATR
jgi:AraC-like DNA-binding protein